MKSRTIIGIHLLELFIKFTNTTKVALNVPSEQLSTQTNVFVNVLKIVTVLILVMFGMIFLIAPVAAQENPAKMGISSMEKLANVSV